MRRFLTTVKKDDIPRFDGRPSSWSRFKERFVSVVGESPNFKEVDKLDHLATAVPCSAKTVLSFANGDQTLADLEQEYADSDEVINDLLHLASDVKPLGKQARGTEWKAFRKEVKNIICLSEHYDLTLQRSLHTALALKLGDHRMEYIRQFGGKTLAQLNAYVGKELEAYRIAEHHEATARASASLPISSSSAGRTVVPKPVATPGLSKCTPSVFWPVHSYLASSAMANTFDGGACWTTSSASKACVPATNAFAAWLNG